MHFLVIVEFVGQTLGKRDHPAYPQPEGQVKAVGFVGRTGVEIEIPVRAGESLGEVKRNMQIE